MVLGLALTAAGSLIGRSDAKDAQRMQEGYYNTAQNQYGTGRAALIAGYDAAEPYMDQLLGAAESLEEDLLSQYDAVTAREIRRIRQEREQSEAMVNQQMAARGLDSFTTRQGAQANAQGQASNAMVELGARMSAGRASAITQGRSAYIQGLGARGQFDVNRGRDVADSYYRQAALSGNTQVVPPNTAQGIGGLIGGLNSMYRTSVLEGALDRSGPGGGNAVNWFDQGLF